MRTIQLDKGQVALIDDEEFERVSKHTWYAKPDKQNYYACTTIETNGKSYTVRMHRFIMGLEKGDKRVVDHISHNTLDNRKENLRVCTNAENCRNRKPLPKTYPEGVSKKTGRSKRYTARIGVNYKRITLGHFLTIEEASKAYQEAKLRYFGEFAYQGKAV